MGAMTRGLVRGALAGAIGGFVGGLEKLGCEAMVPPRPPGRRAPPDVLVERLLRREDSPKAATFAIHFGFSISAGALYGALVELAPRAAFAMGGGFGIAVWAGAHEFAMPALGLTPARSAISTGERTNEAIAHGLWGWTVEVVRSDLRRRMRAAGDIGRA